MSITEVILDFWYNDNLRSTVSVVDGLKHGESRSYHEDGETLEELCYYVNGVRDGQYTRYYDNGDLRELCIFIDGKISGIKVHYGLNNSVASRITYVDGKRHGQCINYRHGRVTHICLFENDRLVHVEYF